MYLSPIGLLYTYWGWRVIVIISNNDHKKLVLDLLGRPHGAHYLVGGGVQDALKGVVVHHEGIVMDKPQIVWTPYQGGHWSHTMRFNTFKYRLTTGVPWFQTTLPSGVINILHNPYPRTTQGGLDPFEDELYNGSGVLRFHGPPNGNPPFGLGNLKKVIESRP